jgi:O-antigen/teichoic acid export membrane protein
VIPTSAAKGRAAMTGSIATGIAGQAVLVASGVILARALGPSDRGVLAIVLLLSGLAAQLGSLGVPVSVTYWVASGRAGPRSVLRRLRVFRGLQLLMVLALHAALILLVLGPRSPAGYLRVGFLSIAATGFGLSQMYGLAVLQGLGRFTAFNLLRLMNGAIYALGVGGLWIANRVSLASVTLVVIGAAALAAGTTWLVVRSAIPPRDAEERVALRSLLSFGARSLVGSAPTIQTYRLDQLLVGFVLSPLALGYYVIGLAFTNLTRFVGQSIGMVTYPRIAAARDEHSRLRVLRHDFALAVGVCGSVTVALVLLAPWLVPFFFGSDFEPATTTTAVLLIAALAGSLRQVLVDGTRGAGRPMWGLYSELLTLLAIPAAAIVALGSDSLEAVALALLGGNLLGLLSITPALWRRSGRLAPSEIPSLSADAR